MTFCTVCGLPLIYERTPDNRHPWCKEQPMSGGISTQAWLVTVFVLTLAGSGILVWVAR